MVFALALRDRQIVDAGDTPAHQAVLAELPILVAVTAEPAAAIVVPLIGEANGDPIVPVGPDLLDQAIVELALPFASQERDDGVAALDELRAVAPAAVDRVGESDTGGIARIPGVLGEPHLFGGGLGGERGKRRAAHGVVSSARGSGSGVRYINPGIGRRRQGFPRLMAGTIPYSAAAAIVAVRNAGMTSVANRSKSSNWTSSGVPSGVLH